MTTFTATESADIVSAIKRSISHNEIVRVTVPSLEQGAQWVKSFDGEYIGDGENPLIDVWGDDGQGGEFRLYLMAE